MDTYLTIAAPAAGNYTEMRSRFLAFAFPVSTVEEVKDRIAECRKSYHDARHVCYAYMLGPERTQFRANDDGEPSGTAGRPILGQINANGLTDILLVVVRYFGGIKLGTSRLAVAYRQAAVEAISAAQIVERIVEQTFAVSFEYPHMNSVMRIVKEEAAQVLSQGYDSLCTLTLRIRLDAAPRLRSRLEKVETLSFSDKRSDDEE